MKKSLLMKTMLLLCALIVGSSAWADEVYYTLDGTKTDSGGNSNYAQTGKDVVQGGMNWAVMANCTINPWRVGGKNLTNENRPAYSKTPMGDAITKVELEVGSITISSVNSITLIVASNSDFSTEIESIVKTTINANSTITFNPSGSKWATGAYYKFVFNVTAGGSNTYIQFKSAKFYHEASSDPSSNAAFTNTTPSINYPATKTYSQVPTIAAGYSGTISYSMTANTAGATIDAESGLVTVTKGGEVTVKATAAAVPGSYAASEASYTLTVNDTRAPAGLAWSAASADVTYGEDNVFPTLTNPNGLTVTYSSSNTSAATINSTSGVITLKDITASTTISAIFAGNDDFKDQTVTYELNVTKAPFALKDGVFDFVGAAGAVPFEDYGSGMTLVTTGYTTDDKTWTAGNVTMVTSCESGNGYRWWEADGTLRFYNGSKSTFSVPSGYVITKIVTTGANFDNANVGTLSGSTWTGVSNEVELSVTATRNIKTITVTYMTPTQTETVQSYGWASYVTPAAVEFPANTAYVVTAASVSTGLTLEAVTQVPEKTPVLLKGAGTKDITVIASASAPATNLLKVSAGYVSAGKYAYVLAKNGAGACFKQWTGDASVLEGRVVLLLDEAVATARDLFELDNDATAIEAVKAQNVENGQFFNLAGQRVAQPTKGLYIVNGKKVIIK